MPKITFGVNAPAPGTHTLSLKGMHLELQSDLASGEIKVEATHAELKEVTELKPTPTGSETSAGKKKYKLTFR